MGIRDAVRSSSDTLRNRLPDPAPLKDACLEAYGVGRATVASVGAAVSSGAAAEVLHSAGAKVRVVATDVAKPVAVMIRSSYDRGLAATLTADQAVRVEGVRRIKGSVPDREGWEKIGRVAVTITDLALDKFSRAYTGGLPVYRVVKEGLRKDGKGENAAAGGREEQLQEMKNRVEQLEEAVMSKKKSEPPNINCSKELKQRSRL